MTHDYKEIWEEFVKRNGEQGFFAEAIRSALQLAQEAEQLRKERDELEDACCICGEELSCGWCVNSDCDAYKNQEGE